MPYYLDDLSRRRSIGGSPASASRSGMGVQAGSPMMYLAIALYVGPSGLVMWLAPVHHVSDPQSMTGMAVVVTRWWMVRGEIPFSLLILTIMQATDQVMLHALAAWCQKLALWSMMTPSDLMDSDGCTALPYRYMLLAAMFGLSLLLVGTICSISLFFGTNLMLRKVAPRIVLSKHYCRWCWVIVGELAPCIMIVSST